MRAYSHWENLWLHLMDFSKLFSWDRLVMPNCATSLLGGRSFHKSVSHFLIFFSGSLTPQNESSRNTVNVFFPGKLQVKRKWPSGTGDKLTARNWVVTHNQLAALPTQADDRIWGWIWRQGSTRGSFPNRTWYKTQWTQPLWVPSNSRYILWSSVYQQWCTGHYHYVKFGFQI